MCICENTLKLFLATTVDGHIFREFCFYNTVLNDCAGPMWWGRSPSFYEAEMCRAGLMWREMSPSSYDAEMDKVLTDVLDLEVSNKFCIHTIC